MVATQADGRLERALHWTEGFGGRECPYLADHHGAVIWHGVHGAGQVVLGRRRDGGPGPTGGPPVGAARLRRAPGGPELVGGARRPGSATRCAAGETYHLYWGDLHRHSLVSRCTSGDEPSLEDFYRYAWDVDEYDFWAVTDHAENSTAYQWWSIQKIADLLHVPGRFVPLYGFEWTSAEHGHQNVIYGDVARGAPIFSAFAEGSTTPDGLWRGLAEHPELPRDHHPAPPRFGHGAQRLGLPRPPLQQARRGVPGLPRQLRVGGVLPAVLRRHRDRHLHARRAARGHRFGFIASSDHGHGASYVAVLARLAEPGRRLRRPAVAPDLCRHHPRRARRACGWARTSWVATSSGPASRPLRVHASGYAELARVDILRDGEVVHVVRGEPPLPPGHRRVDLRVEWGTGGHDHPLGRPADGRGGRLVLPDHVGPEVTEMDEHTLAWQHMTHSFGETYGAQRGGVEVSVCGPADAEVSIECAGRTVRVGLAELAERLATGPFVPDGGGGGGVPASWHCSRPSVPCSVSACARSTSTSGTRRPPGAFYYARVFQVDGELAWSSPIWVAPPPAAADTCS